MPIRFRPLALAALFVATLGCSQTFKGHCQSDADCGYGLACDGSSGERVCRSACGDLACTKAGIRSVAVTDASAATNGYYAADGGLPIPVSVVVVDGVGAPATSAELAVNGTVIAATAPPTVAGPTRTYAFQVPSSLGLPGAEAPLGFTVTAHDAAGNVAVATIPGRLKIDDLGPAAANLAVLTAAELTDAGGLKWYRQALGGSVEVTASVTDAGSGVDPASLKLVLQSDATTRVDTGVVSGPDPGTTTWHFFIPRLGAGPGQIATGAQGVIRFQIAGADMLGHALHLTATGQIGIDGQAPAAPTLTMAGQYPPANDRCGAGTLCGHDGAHFWRLGDDGAKVSFSATDGAGGSGLLTTAGATCDFGAGQPACALQYPATAGAGGVTYQFAINPSQLVLSTDPTGAAQVTATVSVRDAVGNLSPPASAPIAVTRVKWVKQFGAALSSLNTAPILTPPIGTTNPQRQLIIAGAGTAAPNDSIYSLGLDGAVLGSAGHAASPVITSVPVPMAFSPITNSLYVLTNSANAYVFAITNSGPSTNPAACPMGTAGQSSGSPALIGTTAASEVAVVSDAGNNRVRLIAGAANCTTVTSVFVSSAANVLGTPTTDGGSPAASIFVSTGGSDISMLGWDGNTLSLTSHTSINLAKTIAPVAVVGDLFFADNRGPQYHRYTKLFSPVWGGATDGAMDPLASIAAGSGPIVNDGLVFGFADSQNGPLRAFYASTAGGNMAGSVAFAYPSLTMGAGRVSPVAAAGQRTVYFTDSGNRELVALQYVSGSSAAPAMKWKYQGESAFLGAFDTRFTGGGAEPVIGADGTLYFVDGSSVYAILTDTGAGVTPTGGINWPRVAFDNCNSGNSSYTNCQ